MIILRSEMFKHQVLNVKVGQKTPNVLVTNRFAQRITPSSHVSIPPNQNGGAAYDGLVRRLIH